MVCLEDGVTSCGFRKMAAYVAAAQPRHRVVLHLDQALPQRSRGGPRDGRQGRVSTTQVDEIAQGLKDADLVGFSSMTGYAELTRRVIKRVRELDPDDLHHLGRDPPDHPPRGRDPRRRRRHLHRRGRVRLRGVLRRLQATGRDYTGDEELLVQARSTAERNGDEVIQQRLPAADDRPRRWSTLPFPQYGAPGRDDLHARARLRAHGRDDYLLNDGLGYTTLWSIGCPFHCTYCGNTKFIANDPRYKKHPPPQRPVHGRRGQGRPRPRFPHMSQVSFHDDSFMAIPYRELEEFAELWREELALPFAVYGVIPNYVKQDKFELLSWAGMNRVRMGIQSGSQASSTSTSAHTPPERSSSAGEVIASFAPKYHIPAGLRHHHGQPDRDSRGRHRHPRAALRDGPAVHAVHLLAEGDPQHRPRCAMEERGLDLDEIDAATWPFPRGGRTSCST